MSNELEMVLRQLDDPGARTKISEKFSGFIRDRLREDSFNDSVIPPETVDRSECQVSVHHDSLVKIEYLEPKSRAMVVNFRSSPDAQMMRGERVEVPFTTIMSQMFEKPEQEFLAYPFPLAKVIEQNAVRDLEEIKDYVAVGHYESCVQALQTEANGGTPTALNATNIQANAVTEYSIVKGAGARAATVDNGVALPIQREDLVRLTNVIDGRRLRTSTIIMTNTDFNTVMTWSSLEWGDSKASETAVSGYSGNTLLGKRIIRSSKNDILRAGNVYAFTEPEYLGRNYVLNNTKFYIDKVINIVKFVAWMDIAQAFVNIASIAKMELYSGDANPATDADSILGTVTPVAEDELGAENNRVGSDREYFPNVVRF